MATTRAVSVVFSVAMMTIASATVAQVSTGRIDVTVVDGAGAVLQGVAVDIDGPQRHSAVTGVTGEAHFLHLASGRYKLRAKLSGFSDYLNTNVAVGTGAGVPLSIALSVAGVATQVQLTRRAPVVDSRKTGASTNISLDELQNVPSSRDPWVVLQTVPGIIVDRVHVGGAASGQQSNYQAKGAGGGENTWNLDGIAITDMAALGSSPTYYDFDMFQDMQVTTGGAEVTTATPGVHLNMVLKSGGNTPRGSARIYFANEGLQSNNLTPELAAYSMFSSQLGATAAATISATQSSAIYYYAIDTNANRVADPSEILFGLGHAGYYGFDPLNPARLTTVNQIATYATPKTHEVTVGLDHELMPNFAISGTFTYRHFSRFNWNPLIGVTSDDYRQTGTLAGSVDPVGSFSVPFYAINPAAVPPGGGRSFEERQGYHQRFVGFEIGAVKRMSHGWMGRFGFSTNDHREYFDGPSAIEDPTPTPQAPNLDGGVVVTPTAGSGKSDIYMVPPKFQLIANGLAQGPWGVNFGANWTLRQGYATPYFRDNVATGDPLLNAKSVLIAGDVSRFRLPRVSSLDVRVERALTISDVTIVLDLDVFNITNAATVLGKQYNLRRTGPTGFDKVLEIMNPRILRLGARVNF